MKHVDEFTRFLEDEVNLNKTRINTLTDRVKGIQAFLAGSEWPANIVRFSPQGSWAHKTIIKPPEEQGFDADLLVFVRPAIEWTARNYVIELRNTFRQSGVYKEKAHLKTRCVRLEYAGDFDIDIVPCVIDRIGGAHRYEVCNRVDDKFEPSDGEAYTAWLSERNNWTGTDKLREVTRLLKYLRDVKTTFSCKSILLTTLLGGCIEVTDTLYQETYFRDLPTSLKTIVGRLDDYLQQRPYLHDVSNPVLPQENFNRHWDQEKYSNFRDMMHKYREWIDDAYHEPNESESISKWQRVFGDEWGKGLKTGAMTENARHVRLVTVNLVGYSDLVEAFKAVGGIVLSSFRTSLPWTKPPPWQSVANGSVGVLVKATLHDRKGGASLGAIVSGTPIPKFKHILFEACSPTGLPFTSKDYQVQWQVVNTDHDAIEANQLRGGFYRSDSPNKKWEHTAYRGIHWVQAFVIRKRDGRCVGRSDRFFVVVE